MDLNLPKHAVSDRVSRVESIGEGERTALAELDGAGCIRHIFLVPARNNHPPPSMSLHSLIMNHPASGAADAFRVRILSVFLPTLQDVGSIGKQS